MVNPFKKTALVIAAFVFSFLGYAQNQEWQVVSSSITFKIKNAGFTVNGKFSALNASILFDTNKDLGNKIEASIDAATINTDNSTRDAHLKKEEYFYVTKYPKISMSATSITKQNDGKYKGLFNLSIKGITKIIPVIFSAITQNDKLTFSGNFTINRRDFSVGSSSLILADEVTVYMEVSSIKK
jgi:polyisoprenoid-binding protein YceI